MLAVHRFAGRRSEHSRQPILQRLLLKLLLDFSSKVCLYRTATTQKFPCVQDRCTVFDSMRI